MHLSNLPICLKPQKEDKLIRWVDMRVLVSELEYLPYDISPFDGLKAQLIKYE